MPMRVGLRRFDSHVSDSTQMGNIGKQGETDQTKKTDQPKEKSPLISCNSATINPWNLAGI